MLSRALLLGALAAAPVFLAAVISGSERTAVAQCRAVFGSRNNGVCLDDPAPPPPDGGPPSFNVGGPGEGISTSPLLPGQTISIPLA